MRSLAAAVLALGFALPALADDITPRLEAALAAQSAGDLKTLTAELAAATAAVNAERGKRLEALLPAAPEGMTQTLQADYMANLAIMGGGTGAEAGYASEDGSTYATVTYNIDTPLLAGMMSAFATPEMQALMGPQVELNGLSFIDQTSAMTALVDGRLMVTVNGSDPETIRKLAEAIDGAALIVFDAPK
jgi:hypothetical protein